LVALASKWRAHSLAAGLDRIDHVCSYLVQEIAFFGRVKDHRDTPQAESLMQPPFLRFTAPDLFPFKR
jgi:hypothetical protein